MGSFGKCMERIGWTIVNLWSAVFQSHRRGSLPILSLLLSGAPRIGPCLRGGGVCGAKNLSLVPLQNFPWWPNAVDITVPLYTFRASVARHPQDLSPSADVPSARGIFEWPNDLVEPLLINIRVSVPAHNDSLSRFTGASSSVSSTRRSSLSSTSSRT